MSLNEIDKDLQQKDSKIIEREHDETVYNVWQSSNDGKKEKKDWEEIEDKMVDTRTKSLKIGAIVIAFILLVIVGMFVFSYFKNSFFAQDRVTLEMESPETVDSNKLIEIVFEYKNDNRAQLNNAQILVEFGDYFSPIANQENFDRASDRQGVINIGTIKGEGHGKFSLAGYFVGPVGAVDDVSGILRYTPEKTNVRYETSARSATTIISSPISINISAPSEVISGNLVDIMIAVKNGGQDKLNNLKLTLDAPAGFTIINSNPLTSSLNTWLINSIDAKSEFVITLRGALDSSVGDVQTFKASVGTQEDGENYVEYAQEKYSPRIVKSPIYINHTTPSVKNDVVNVGERVQYEIAYINNGEMSLRDAVVSIKFDTEALDFSTLQLNEGGNYDEENQKITWKAADISNLKTLKPKESGKIRFTVAIKEILPIESKEDYNFYVTSITSISSEDVPSKLEENKTVLGNVLENKVGAKVGLNSDLGYISGSEQLKVGEKTKYIVNLTIDNINNDLSDAAVAISMPSHVVFEDGGDGLTFNDRTNELVWKIGSIKHGAGITDDQVKTSFEVSVIPSVDQIGKSPLIMKTQVLTATDMFTNEKIMIKAESMTTAADDRGSASNTVEK